MIAPESIATGEQNHAASCQGSPCAAVLDGQSRGAAARIGGMDRQTLRDWVHAYNAKGPNGLINATSPGRPPKLTKAQKEKLRPIIVAGPDPVKDGVVRWRCVDLKRVIKERLASISGRSVSGAF